MKTIVNFCPTGMVPTKSQTPHVPISVQEIVEQTHEAYELGITIAHLHARMEDGQPTYKTSVYGPIFEGVRKHCPDLIICGSTSGRNFPEFEKRSEVIDLKPDMCSLTLSSLNFVKTASVNAPEMIKALLAKMIENGVRPELECFDMGMINYGKYLLHHFDLKEPQYWNLIFGNIAGFQPTFSQMGAALQEIPEGHHIGVGGIGAYQLKSNSMAISAGLGVRTGLEDNLWLDAERSKAATNISLLKRIHKLMEINGSTLMRSAELGFYNKLKCTVPKL